MDIMHACDFIPLQWQREENEKKKVSKDLYI
jgi:hypothetical protein